MEKSGEKLHKSFCQNGLLARQADKEVLGRFAEQTHEYNEVVRMAFRKLIEKSKDLRRVCGANIFQRKVVKDIHCSVLKDQTFKQNRKHTKHLR